MTTTTTEIPDLGPNEEDRAALTAALEHLLRRSRQARTSDHLAVDLEYLDDYAKASSLARLDRNAIRYAAKLLRRG